jgi:Ca2+-binding EF-hand superfamily protein
MLKLKDGSEVTTSFMLELFDSIDEDGSGEIDVDELFEAVKKTGLESISMDQVKKMVRIADTDGDGLISKDEWINLAMKKKSSKRRLL